MNVEEYLKNSPDKNFRESSWFFSILARYQARDMFELWEV